MAASLRYNLNHLQTIRTTGLSSGSRTGYVWTNLYDERSVASQRALALLHLNQRSILKIAFFAETLPNRLTVMLILLAAMMLLLVLLMLAMCWIE